MHGIASLALGAILVLLATNAIGAEIHRCTDGGKTTYSDRPCDGKRVTVNVADSPAPVIEVPTDPIARTIVAARNARVGMKANAVKELLGKPAQISRTERGPDVVEHWIYCHDGVMTEMVVRNGVVSQIDESVSVANVGTIPVSAAALRNTRN